MKTWAFLYPPGFHSDAHWVLLFRGRRDLNIPFKTSNEAHEFMGSYYPELEYDDAILPDTDFQGLWA